MTTYRILKNWISRCIYSSSPVRHAGRYFCLTSRNVSPVAVLSDTLCLTVFSLGVFELNHRQSDTVTFSKTFEKWLDHHVWQRDRKGFLRSDQIFEYCLTVVRQVKNQQKPRFFTVSDETEKIGGRAPFQKTAFFHFVYLHFLLLIWWNLTIPSIEAGLWWQACQHLGTSSKGRKGEE